MSAERGFKERVVDAYKTLRAYARAACWPIRRNAQRVCKFLKSPADIMMEHGARGSLDWMSDELYLKLYYRLRMHSRLNLRNPRTFCEKVNWLKAHDHNPRYTELVDKVRVKQVVSEAIGDEHVIPLLGVYSSFDDIDFAALPDRFVLKCTHDSGSYVVCEDKEAFDVEAARAKLESKLRRSYYAAKREWAYRDVEPRIIAEGYVDGLGKPDSVEYKLTCFGGKVGLVTICKGIPHSTFDVRYNDFYDRELNHLPFYVNYPNAPQRPQIPPQIHDMIAFSEKLSAGIPQVRVDWYLDAGRVLFGEMTFYTWNGVCPFSPPEYDRIVGDMIDLSLVEDEFYE